MWAFRALLVVATVAWAGGVSAGEAGPEEVLKSKGLVRVGVLYLLEGDVRVMGGLRGVRAARVRLDDNTARRGKLERTIAFSKAAILRHAREGRDLNQKLGGIPKKDVERYNFLVGQINAERVAGLEAVKRLEDAEKELSKLPDPRPEYARMVLEIAAAMEETASRYEALAADEAVRGALAEISAKGGPAVRLGPSQQFALELPGIRRQRDMARTAPIKLKMEGGVPHVNVMLNGSLELPMVLDSGAAGVTLTAEVGQKLGLVPGPDAPEIETVGAEGKVTKVKLMVLESLSVGQFTVENVECMVYPRSVAGSNLLGGAFLKNFIYRMDLVAGEVHLSQISGRDETAAARKAATQRRDEAVRQAEESYFKAVMMAERELIRELSQLLTAVDQKNDVAAVERLSAAKSDAEAALGRAAFRAEKKAVTVKVNATDDWRDFVEVRKGDVLVITATGTWTGNIKGPRRVGPEGSGPQFHYLAGSIGEQKFRIDSGVTVTAQQDGVLRMRMHDSIYDDNDGYLTVTVGRK